ncbi:TonB-dependent receptor [Hyphomonas sp.]|uniref:TonB-dependent receptor plug domain-containing protein n=1 Tax=Hyphomonas sp. TaxID=87 RepID=UPI000DFBF1E7|nr:MAG: TonB-dependent receptor [Hyphomonas sp.]
MRASKLRTQLLSCAFATVSLSMITAAQAQEGETDDVSVQEAVTVTGSRGKPRSIQDSPVPIDVLGEDELNAVPFTDTNDVLKTLIPSYSLSRQPISDGSSFVRPAEMRGLPTDKTLVLVNSKRRHRAALVTIGGSGTQGPDVATIPASALKSIEVLRDGAAAQYGSDAIAGVINFLLKDNSEGGSVSVDIGQYYEGDGFQYTVSGNYGFDLGGKGFLSVSGEVSKADATSRSEQYCESWFCLDPSNPDFDPTAGYAASLTPEFIEGVPSASLGDFGVVQPWGQPTSEAFRLFYNSAYTINDNAELYSFGNYSSSKSDGSFFYRYPGNGTIEDLRLEDGSIYSPLEIFPGGFTPRFFGDVTDYSFVGGLRGLFAGFDYDLSARYGHNEIEYTLANTINPSMGPDTPTVFRPGDLINEEAQIQADFSKEFEVGLASPLLFAMGLSYLDESYELVEGDKASYEDGPFAGADPFGFCDAMAPTAAGVAVMAAGSTLDCSDPDDPVYQVVGVGSNGFPGYSPAFSEDYTRDSHSIYADLSADVTEKLFLQGALRYESYSDFDAETVWKIAGRYEINDILALRSSIGTGFRAPTPGQQGTTNVSTRLPNGFPVATGLFPASGPVAQALGATPLKPETSTNYTLGMTSNFENMSLTVDFYQIDLADRVNAISTQDVSSDPASGTAYDNYLALVAAGVTGAESIGGVFYFTNAFDTTTSGVDIVATYTMPWANGQNTSFTGSVNYNKTEFDSDVDALFNDESQFDFLNGTPNWRGVFTVLHQAGPISLLGRANYYGGYENAASSTLADIQEWDGEILFDFEASYEIDDALTLSAGVRNAFDNYPDAGDAAIGETCCGRIYRSDSVVDWQGGYYYVKASATF